VRKNEKARHPSGGLLSIFSLGSSSDRCPTPVRMVMMGVNEHESRLYHPSQHAIMEM